MKLARYAMETTRTMTAFWLLVASGLPLHDALCCPPADCGPGGCSRLPDKMEFVCQAKCARTVDDAEYVGMQFNFCRAFKFTRGTDEPAGLGCWCVEDPAEAGQNVDIMNQYGGWIHHDSQKKCDIYQRQKILCQQPCHWAQYNADLCDLLGLIHLPPPHATEQYRAAILDNVGISGCTPRYWWDVIPSDQFPLRVFVAVQYHQELYIEGQPIRILENCMVGYGFYQVKIEGDAYEMYNVICFLEVADCPVYTGCP